MSPQGFRKDSYRNPKGVRATRTPGMGMGTGKGDLEREARAITKRLSGSSLPSGYIHTAARWLLEEGQSTDNEAVIAEARRHWKAACRIFYRHAQRRGDKQAMAEIERDAQL